MQPSRLLTERKSTRCSCSIARLSFFTHRTTILKLAMKARLPVISGERPYADEGALMSYGPSYEDRLRRTTKYVDKILKGGKPSSLPIAQPTKFDWFSTSRPRRRSA